MSSTRRAARSALVVLAAMVAIVAFASVAGAQRNPPRIGRAGQAPPQPTAGVPYPGATVIVQPFSGQQVGGQFPHNQFSRRHDRRGSDGFASAPVVYPGYGAYGSVSGVYDTNGRPLYAGYEIMQAQAQQQQAPAPGSYNDFPAITPDLSGSPYAVIEGGTMVVDFGNGDRRAVPSCAAVESASTPDGKPRTLFYRPPAYQLILRPGQRGQVFGKPTAGARVCYTNDQYGRVVLAY
jgi:hypothetical protein